ncbi:ensconsin [Trichomycterus rosablanca]|uniref:ensconsin n=1 Tax=Trichomycterus rosablanca TaxID=2290929 RepID=UPI002F3587CB
MPAPCMSVALQQRKWRQAGKVANPNLILQEEGKIKMTRKGTGMDVKSKQEQNRPSYNSSVETPPNIINHRKNENPAESNMLKVDERLRLARERREENLRQLALRERGWLARDERARRYYEKHLEERRKKLEEQRQREERRRMAVEEKRKQRLKEEKERFVSVVQKTMARSQKTKPKTARSSQRGASSGKNNIINVSCHSMNNTSAQKSVQSPATSTHRNVIRPGLIRGKHQTSSKEAKSEKNKLQSLTDTARVNSTPGRVKQNKPVSLLTGLPVRQMSPRQECLPALTEEEDLKLETIPSYHQPQKCEAAPSNVHEVGCKGPAWKNIDSTGSLVPPACPYTATEPSIHSAGVQSRPQAGTTDPEKASRLLSEKRRQARMQREREEEECRLKEERREREGLGCQKAHEWVRQEAETLELQEQKRIREEEKQINAENENTQQQEEEKQKLQHQKEEEDAQQRQVAEQRRIERESRFQREETERQERKKRLEEIMKRTRKTDAAEKKVVSSNLIIKETLPDEIMKPIHSLPLEEVIRLPGTASVSKMGLDNEEDILPVVAFKERRSIRTITGLEEIQSHQRAEVI